MKKLKRILLINWLYFSKQLIEVGDINFLTGNNGAGKSTIVDALQIVLLGETNARNFNKAANEKSQRTLDGYLLADMDENNPYSRRGKDFSSYIACEFCDETEGTRFVTGIVFDCRSDRTWQYRYFIYNGTIPVDHFIENGEAMDIPTLRTFLKQNYSPNQKLYDSNTQYRADMVAKWNVQTEQVLRMLKKAVSFRPIVDIQQFITENICDIPNKPNIEEMQQNIRDYKRHGQLARQQEEKLKKLQEIAVLYREMNQAIDRYRQHRFLTLWAGKEDVREEIQRRELEMQEHREEIQEAAGRSEAASRQVEEKEKRKDELMIARAQSNVYQEQERLAAQKAALLSQRGSLSDKLQKVALDIKRESNRLYDLVKTMQDFPAEGPLPPLLDAAAKVKKHYADLCGCGDEIFAGPISVFEKAQGAAENFSSALRDAAYQVEVICSRRRGELNQKNAVLASLRKNIKDYPKGLLPLKEQLRSELKAQTGYSVQIDILADVLEISPSQEQWRGVIEGYLNTQKFYLLVPPEHYREALRIYDRLKGAYPSHSFGLVDVGKLRERERLDPWDDSLAKKIETENDLARSYIDYLLGRVVCCAHIDQLRRHKTAITAEGMLYQGYVARPLRRELMENAYIGRRAVTLRISRLEEEFREVQREAARWEPIHDILSRQRSKEPLFTQYFVCTVVQEQLEGYSRILEIDRELEDLREAESHLDLFWLDEQKKLIQQLADEITALRNDSKRFDAEKARKEERLRHLEYELLPERCQRLYGIEKQLENTFSSDFIEMVGLPRYRQELARLKKAAVIYKNFSGRLEQTRGEQEDAQKKLFRVRRDYTERFKPCSFSIEVMDNEEFAAEQKRLEESELPRYREKIKASWESAIEQFRSDFIDKLRSGIEQVQEQVKDLNRSLRQTQFGADRYQFRVERNPDYAEYYDMITAPEAMDGDKGLFAIPFQEKYGALMEELFSRIAMADDTQLNARKQSELQGSIERYTDFRTYLKFDLETIDQNGSKQLLSQTLNTKSGGETQTPFYIAVLASFAQLYQVNSLSHMANNTVRLVVFDEAFNKMDSDRIIESVRLLRKMGLQAIICTPPEKAADIAPIADRTFVVTKHKYQMHILPFGKEISPL